MSKPAFTPGPWRVAGERDYRTLAFGVFELEHNWRIADVRATNEKIGQANATLIAAAPDMYEALKNIVTRFENCCRASGNDAEWVADATKMHRAALAKAEGRTP